MPQNSSIDQVFSESVTQIQGQHRTVTTFFKGSPTELLRDLCYQKKTGTLEISISQGGFGITKFTEKEKVM
jgi:hypothetical protein